MDRTAVGAVSGDVRRDRRGDRPLPLFSVVPLRRVRGDVPNLRGGGTGAAAGGHYLRVPPGGAVRWGVLGAARRTGRRLIR